MQPPLLSIVVALYQIETLLPAFLTSLSRLLDDEPRLEAVLVDDGSRDSTGHLARDFEANHANARLVVHTENKGLFRARQTGVDASRGQFVWLVDGDDILLGIDLDFIDQTMVSLPEVDLFCFQFIETREPNASAPSSPHTPGTYKSVSDQPILFPLLYWGNIWRFITRRDILVRYYSSTAMQCDMGEDLVLTCWLAACIDTAMLADMPIYMYRRLRRGSYTERLQPIDRIATSVELFHDICVRNANNLDPLTRSMLALFSLPMRAVHRSEAERAGRTDLVRKCLDIDDLSRGMAPEQSDLTELIQLHSIGVRPATAAGRAKQILKCLETDALSC